MCEDHEGFQAEAISEVQQCVDLAALFNNCPPRNCLLILPNNILCSVCRYLSLPERGTVMAVCKRFYLIAHESWYSINKFLSLNVWPIKDSRRHFLSCEFDVEKPRYDCVVVSGSTRESIAVDLFPLIGRYLDDLQLAYSRSEDYYEWSWELLSHCSNLRTLDLSASRRLLALLSNLRLLDKLENLSLMIYSSDYAVVEIKQFFSKLNSLRMFYLHADIRWDCLLTLNGHNLTHFSLCCNIAGNQEDLTAFLRTCPNLIHLSIYYVYWNSTWILDVLATSAPNIEVIDFGIANVRLIATKYDGNRQKLRRLVFHVDEVVFVVDGEIPDWNALPLVKSLAPGVVDVRVTLVELE